MELRPCFDGFAGIPQETRVLFSAFHDLQSVEPVGLLNHSRRRLAAGRSLFWNATDTAAPYNRVAKLIISSEDDGAFTPIDRLRVKTENSRAALSLAASVGPGARIPLRPVDGARFVDYFWQRLFEKGLSPDEFDRVRDAKYVSMRPAWLHLHSLGLVRRYPLLETRGFDIFVAHTPWPSRVSPETELVVRYHDAIPMFLPHQVKRPGMHHQHHAAALRQNVRTASFVCNSEATRRDLLTLYPQVEDRTAVIPVSVSGDYYPEQVNSQLVGEIVRSYQAGGRPAPLGFFEEDSYRYLLMVSTIEPRKNHLRLIDAWERIRRQTDPELNLILVGSAGWGQGPVVNRIKKWHQRKGLYHLTDVPTQDLRILYSNAAATVCPSVAEGFDMSGIEAMLCGSVVVASDIPVHRETYDEAGVYFDPYDTSDLAEALRHVLYEEHHHQRCEELIHRGFTQSKLYRRSDVADQWALLFEDIRAGRFGGRGRQRA